MQSRETQITTVNEQMLVDKQNELMSDLLFTVHQYGGDDVTWKPPMATQMQLEVILAGNRITTGVL